MKKADLEQFRLIVREEIQPVRDMTLSLKQTIHGTEQNPETGLVYEFSAMKKKVWKLTAVTNIVTAGLTAFGSWLFKGHG